MPQSTICDIDVEVVYMDCVLCQTYPLNSSRGIMRESKLKQQIRHDTLIVDAVIGKEMSFFFIPLRLYTNSHGGTHITHPDSCSKMKLKLN